MKKVIVLLVLFSLSQTTFAGTSRPKDPKYKLGRKLNRAAIVVVGTAFLINVIRVIKIAK